MLDGFIYLDRKILNWEWYQDATTMRLFIHMILKANWKEKKWKGITIPRGSFVSSDRMLAAELGVSEKNIRNAIKKLQKTGEVGRQSTSRFSLFSVTNYDLYQTEWADRRTDKGQTEGRQRSDEGQQLNKDNKDNKEINNSLSIAPTRDEVEAYLTSRGMAFDIDAFMDYYQARGWKVNGEPMEDWQALARGWERKGKTIYRERSSGRKEEESDSGYHAIEDDFGI